MITITELAKILNLAPSTVSMALNDRKGISAEVKMQVKEAAKKYGYMPFIKSRQTGMYNTDSKVISIIYPQCDIHVTETVQSGIDTIIKEHDYHKIRYTFELFDILLPEKSKEMYITDILENTKTNGIILFSIPLSEVTLAKLVQKGIFIIFLNTNLDYGKCVYMNNIDASFKAVQSLINMGKKEIGLVIPEASMGLEWEHRFSGYKKALIENELTFKPENIFWENDFSNLKKIGYATINLLRQNPDIDGILYGNDILAFGGLKALKDLEKKIPEDIAIIGIDNMPIDTVLSPSLSSVKMPYKKMGEAGAKMLLKTIDKKKYKPEHMCMNGSEVIMRNSCIKNYKNEKWS